MDDRQADHDFCADLERELAEREKDLSILLAQQGEDAKALAAVIDERDEARACLLEAITMIHALASAGRLIRWQRAAGLEGGK
jgi:hypothetical protein